MKKMLLLILLLLVIMLGCGKVSSDCHYTITCIDGYSESGGGHCPAFLKLGCSCTEYCY